MVKSVLVFAVLLSLASACGGTGEPAADRAGTTTALAAEAHPRTLQFSGNRVPEEPWWQGERADPEAPEAPPPPEETFEISGDLLFDESSTELGPAASTQLQHLVDELVDDPGAIVVITGHTDSTPGPTPDYNETLSQARADAVRDWVVASGTEARRTTTEGRADREPIASNETDFGRSLNRRVTITIRRTG